MPYDSDGQRSFRFVFDDPGKYRTRDAYVRSDNAMLNYDDNIDNLHNELIPRITSERGDIWVTSNSGVPEAADVYSAITKKKVGSFSVTKHGGLVYDGLVLDEMLELFDKYNVFMGEKTRFEKMNPKRKFSWWSPRRNLPRRYPL